MNSLCVCSCISRSLIQVCVVYLTNVSRCYVIAYEAVTWGSSGWGSILNDGYVLSSARLTKRITKQWQNWCYSRVYKPVFMPDVCPMCRCRYWQPVISWALSQGIQLPENIEQCDIKLTWTEHQLHVNCTSTQWVYDVTSIRTYMYQHGHDGILWQLSACANSMYQALSPSFAHGNEAKSLCVLKVPTWHEYLHKYSPKVSQ